MSNKDAFINQMESATKAWMLRAKQDSSTKFNPTLVMSQDSVKYGEFVFLNIGSIVAVKYGFKTLLIDLNPYSKQYHGQLVKQPLSSINQNGKLSETNIVSINKTMDFTTVTMNSEEALSELVISKQFQTFLTNKSLEYDAVFINAPVVSNKFQNDINLGLIKLVSERILVVKRNLTKKKTIRQLASMMIEQGGNVGSIYVQ